MDRAGIERGPRTHWLHIFRHSTGSIIHKKTGSIKEQLKLVAEVLANAISPTLCPPEVGGLPTMGAEA